MERMHKKEEEKVAFTDLPDDVLCLIIEAMMMASPPADSNCWRYQQEQHQQQQRLGILCLRTACKKLYQACAQLRLQSLYGKDETQCRALRKIFPNALVRRSKMEIFCIGLDVTPLPLAMSTTFYHLPQLSFHCLSFEDATRVDADHYRIAGNRQEEFRRWSQVNFPFYVLRYGSVTHFFECDQSELLIDAVCVVGGGSHYVLVIGNSVGLVNELQDDFRIVCSQINLTPAQQRLLVAYRSITDRARKIQCSLLENPTYEEFTFKFKEICTNSVARNICIVYAGHGAANNGSLFFANRRFVSGAEFAATLSEIQHHQDVKLILNCCYGFAFTQALVDSTQAGTSSPTSVQDWFAGLLSVTNRQPTKHFLELIKKDDGNHTIVDNMIRLYLGDHRYGFRVSLDDDRAVYVWPFAPGALNARGVLTSVKIAM